MTIYATDNFNRANTTSGLNSTNWAHNTAEGGDLMLVGSTVTTGGSGLSDDLYYYTATTAPANQYVTVVYGPVTAAGVGAGIGPCCRAASDPTNTKYRAVGSASGYQLNRVITASYTNLASGAGTVFASSDSFTLQVSGSNPSIAWVMQKNGTTFTNATDNPGGTQLDAAGSFAIGYSSQDIITSVRSFEGGSLDTGGGIVGDVWLYGDLSGIGSGGRFFKDPLQ